jgi:Nif-specific regulatory protein
LPRAALTFSVARTMEEPDRKRFRLERDLYRGLLELNTREDPGPFLEGALRLIVDVLGADQGYLEVAHANEEEPLWTASGCSDDQVQLIRTIVSRGIIQQAMAQGQPVVCPSAILDPRFKDRPSVQAARIEAVLCVPIVRKTPIGVLYVTGHRAGGSFAPEEVERATTFARYLSPQIESLFIRLRQRAADCMAPFRKKLKLGDVAGESAALARVIRQVEVMSPLDVSILITGEIGTGKSQLARLIHDNGRRQQHRFVELNCAALPENLIESELFGHEAGAFTGAVRRSEGKVAAAERGTLFLDEVAELSLGAQAKLLTFLQTKKYFRVGGSAELTADVRIIAATNKELEDEVRDRRFREDLYFRLLVLAVRMPSLSERREDIPILARHFAAQAQSRHNLTPRELSPGALRALESNAWKGNLRELANTIERGVIQAEGENAEWIEASHLFETCGQPGAGRRATFHEETRRFQAAFVQRTLESVDWNVAAAARIMDLTRAHTYNLIRTFELELTRKKRPSEPPPDPFKARLERGRRRPDSDP